MNRVEIDRLITSAMDRCGRTASRISLGVIFFWFGVLKPLGISPAEPLILSTVQWLPGLEGKEWVVLIGWWEVAIGVSFLTGKALRVGIVLLVFQLVGTALPLVMLPGVTFQEGHFPYGLTMEGQYIIKNLLIISAALVVGGSIERSEDAAG